MKRRECVKSIFHPMFLGDQRKTSPSCLSGVALTAPSISQVPVIVAAAGAMSHAMIRHAVVDRRAGVRGMGEAAEPWRVERHQ